MQNESRVVLNSYNVSQNLATEICIIPSKPKKDLSANTWFMFIIKTMAITFHETLDEQK